MTTIQQHSHASISNQPLALVLGDGPGLGQALLTGLQHAGMQVMGISRSPKQHAYPHLSLDLNHPNDRETLASYLDNHGTPDVVIHNTATLVIKAFDETSSEEFIASWQSMVLSAFHLAQLTLPLMAQRGSGTWITSGATASLRGSAQFAAFSAAKFALRGLTQSLARQYQQQGVHVVHTILDGILNTPHSRDLHGLPTERMMQLEDVVSNYLHLIQQPRSSWTHELDLRPMGETF